MKRVFLGEGVISLEAALEIKYHLIEFLFPVLQT